MKTKPFNLEEALSGKKVVTRDGRPVTEIFAFKSPLLYPVRYVVGGEVRSATNEGISYNGINADLFMAVETKTYYRNSWVYYGKVGTRFYEEESKAKEIVAENNNTRCRFFEIAVPVEVEM